MVCQNCKSTEIIDIQGQNYCINCGQLVNPENSKINVPAEKKNPQKVTKKTESKPVIANNSSSAIRKGAKSARKAEPVVANSKSTVQKAASAQDYVAPKPIIKKPVVSKSATHASSERGKKTTVQTGAPTAPAPKRHMSDIRPVPKQTRIVEPTSQKTEPRAPKTPIQSPITQGKKPTSAKLFVFATFIGLLGAGLPYVLFSLHKNTDWGLSLAQLLTVGATWKLIAYLIASLLAGKLIYFCTQRYRETSKPNLAFKAGLNSWPRIIAVDVNIIICILLLQALYSAGLIQLEMVSDQTLRTGLLLVQNVFALVLVLGLCFTKMFATITVVVSGVKSLGAIKLGWALAVKNYVRSVYVATFNLFASIIIITPVVCFALVAENYIETTAAVFIGAILASIAFASIAVLTANLWVDAFMYAINGFYTPAQTKLLISREPKSGGGRGLVLLSLVIAILGAGYFIYTSPEIIQRLNETIELFKIQ